MKEYWQTYRFIILALLVLVAGLMVFLSRTKQTDTAREGNFQLDRGLHVVRIDLGDSKQEGIRMERTPEGWVINDQKPANEPAINDLLATVRNLIVRFPVPLARQPQVKEDLQQNGIHMDIYARRYLIPFPGGKGLIAVRRKVSSIIIGQDTPDGEGTYMIRKGAETPFVVQLPGFSGGLREIFLPMVHLWSDPVLIDLTRSQILRVLVTWPQLPQESFLLEFLKGEPKLFTPAGNALEGVSSIDQQRLESYISGFSDLYYEQMVLVENLGDLDRLMFPEPFMVLQVTDTEERVTTLTFFRRFLPEGASLLNGEGDYDPNRFYIQMDSGTFVMGQYFVFNRVMRPLSFFRHGSEQ